MQYLLVFFLFLGSVLGIPSTSLGQDSSKLLLVCKQGEWGVEQWWKNNRMWVNTRSKDSNGTWTKTLEGASCLPAEMHDEFQFQWCWKEGEWEQGHLVEFRKSVSNSEGWVADVYERHFAGDVLLTPESLSCFERTP